ncbi:MAG: hypothetical protein A2176_10935 [Spirochaetes bacterium RBG_13_51_14]|nr:MAG: hypothetical protein A2176_10935 [Spirochaetes bacterium RBG_13_51_14]
MKTKTSRVCALMVIVFGLASLLCATNRRTDPTSGDVPLSDVGIEKKYLTEGFISSDRYRVVVISPKETEVPDRAAIEQTARKRARVSLERSLASGDNQCDRNTSAEIINLIERNGRLSKKEIDNTRYDVYYFVITKKNMKEYLKNIPSQR